MNAAAIEYIWKAIQESERSDEFPFMDDEKSITAAAHGSLQPRSDQSRMVSRRPITELARSVLRIVQQ